MAFERGELIDPPTLTGVYGMPTQLVFIARVKLLKNFVDIYI